MAGILAMLKRQGRYLMEGAYGKPPQGKWLENQTHHGRWKSGTVGGKAAVTNNITIGGELGDLSTDPTKYIQKIDPQNSSGAIKDALEIIQKLKDATFSDSLMSSIIPLESILGGQLYASAKKSGAQSKAKQKAQQQQPTIPAIVLAMIEAAIALLSAADAALVSDLMTSQEADAINKAFQTGQPYTSTTMPQSFIDAINQLLPGYRGGAVTS